MFFTILLRYIQPVGSVCLYVHGQSHMMLRNSAPDTQQLHSPWTCLCSGLAHAELSSLQVINRDLSVAVLQHLATHHQAELKAGRLKRLHSKKGVPPRPAGSSRLSPVDGISVLEGLAATGLRSIRYALEVC